MVLITTAFISHLIRDSVIVAPDAAPPLLKEDWFYLLTYYMPLTLAIAIGIIVAWRYWSWIVKEPQE